MKTQELDRQIYNRAIALLARREHSEKELRDKLARVFPDHEALIQGAVERLKDDHYLSNLRFAVCYIRARANRGFGAERIFQELASKGVDSDTGALALQELEQTELDWSTVIEQVWRKKFSKPPGDLREKYKQMRFLQYRGFSHAQIASLLDVWSAE